MSNPPTVLIGEHSLSVARDLGEAFIEAGYQVLGTCTDGLSLVSAVRQHNPSVICLDIILPRLSGLQVLETLGEHNAQVVVATAVSSRSRVAEAKKLGVSVYMLKPAQREKLVSALRGLNPMQMRSAS